MADDVVKSRLKNKKVSGQGREMLSNVYTFMKDEAKNGLTIPLSKARQRTAAATGVSERMVTKINAELKKLQENDGDEPVSFLTPDKKRSIHRPVTGLDDFNMCVVRRLVYNFHFEHKRLPTTELLLDQLKDRIDFKGGKSSLRSILKTLGFTWRRTQNNRKLLIEHEDIREKRITFLRQIKRFREQGRPIIYLDETYIHSNHHASLSWSDNSTKGFRAPISKGDRLIIIHAGGEQGFVPNALTIWKANSHSGDYHDNVNTDMFIKWLNERLLPNLEPRSVIVIDNAPYHNTQVDKAPTTKSRKQDMKDWLTKHNVPFSDDMFVPELYKLVLLHKPRFIRFVIDELVEKEEHTILRLPPYHPDLNPIELIWADIKGHVSRMNTTSKMTAVQQICEDKIASMGPEDWEPKCVHVKGIENEYSAREPAIDDLMEAIVITQRDSDSDMWSEHDEDEPDDMSGIEEMEEEEEEEREEIQ